MDHFSTECLEAREQQEGRNGASRRQLQWLILHMNESVWSLGREENGREFLPYYLPSQHLRAVRAESWPLADFGE